MTGRITTAQINQNCSTCVVYMCGSKKTCVVYKCGSNNMCGSKVMNMSGSKVMNMSGSKVMNMCGRKVMCGSKNMGGIQVRQ